MQFDVFTNPAARNRAWAPYVLDLQHPILRDLHTRVVAPLIVPGRPEAVPIQQLNPIVVVEGRQLMVSTSELAAVATSELDAPVTNLADQRDALLAAIDLLFSGV